MKIAHIMGVLFDKMGGLQVCVHNVCERLASRGHDVTLYASYKKRPKFKLKYNLKKLPRFHAHPRLYRADPIIKLFASKYIERLQKKYHYDLWQVNNGYPYGVLLADSFEKRGVPSVLRCCGTDIQIDEELAYGVRRNPIIDRAIRESYKKFKACVAISKTVQDEYVEMGICEEKINMIPNGVDFERISNERSQAINIREKFGIPDDAKILLTVGRNHPKKGYENIPRIMSKLLDVGHNVYWIIVGKGCNDIREILKTDEIKKRIITVEQIEPVCGTEIPSEELLDYYRQADIFVMLSRLETFGVVSLEAMATGLPIVCFDAPGVRDVFNDACGIKVRLGNNNEMVRAIDRIIQSEDCTKEMSKNCIEYAKEYSWDKIADKYLELYEGLVAR